MRHRETPTRRINPGGGVVWVARYTAPDGRRLSNGTYDRKGPCKTERDDGRCCAQHAIDAAYETPVRRVDTVGAYAKTWTRRHPRAERTNKTNDHRISRVLDVKLEGRALRDWAYADLRRRHARELVDVMLTEQGRTTTGAVNILRALSAMSEDAIADEIVGVNAFKGVRVRSSDPRATKKNRKVRVYSWEQMHRFAAAAGEYEAMLRVMSDCGLRLGEVLGLSNGDVRGDVLSVRGNAHDGVFTEGDQPTKRHVRTVPIPPALGALLRARPRRIDTQVLFPTPGGQIWWESNFRRDVWNPIKALRVDPDDESSDLVFADMRDARPHLFRHSWESLLHAAGVDPADLAQAAGHTLSTMTGRYVHPLNQSSDAIRKAVG